MTRFESRKDAGEAFGATADQSVLEMYTAYCIIASRQPKRFVEIGSHRGGTLWVYADACDPSATIVTIDDGVTPGHAYLQETIRALWNEHRRTFWMRAKSQDPDVAANMDEVLEGPIDLLHIDGCHDEAAVIADWNRYREYMAPNGLVLFHDIFSERYTCPFAWAEIKKGLPYIEINAPGRTHIHPKGIGILDLSRM